MDEEQPFKKLSPPRFPKLRKNYNIKIEIPKKLGHRYSVKEINFTKDMEDTIRQYEKTNLSNFEAAHLLSKKYNICITEPVYRSLRRKIRKEKTTNKNGTRIACTKCGYAWHYLGNSNYYITCPRCLGKIKSPKSASSKVVEDIERHKEKGGVNNVIPLKGQKSNSLEEQNKLLKRIIELLERQLAEITHQWIV